jgi:hypothetical protein
MNVITTGSEADEDRPPSVGSMFLEARVVDRGVEVLLAGPATSDTVVEVSPFLASPDDFSPLGVIMAGSNFATFAGLFSPGTRIRVGEQLQFLAFPDLAGIGVRPVSTSRPNYDSTPQELFASDAAAMEWREALTRLLLTDGQVHRTDASPSPAGQRPRVVQWRTLEDADEW